MIRFDRVTKLYPGNSRPALNAVDIEIKSGEFVFLVGASGSGKSSFLRLVLKEDRPSSGEIHVLGQKLNSISNRKVPYFRRNLGVVFQDFRLLPNRTVFANVAFTLQVIGKSKGFIQEAVPDVLKMVGLAGKANRMPHELSGGEQQRVAIARAVVNKPAILLADEPTGNLDPATSAGIMQVLQLINASGTTVVMATHDVTIVDNMQRRVIELIGGNVVRDERRGGYQTTAIITQQDPAAAAPAAAMDSPAATDSPSARPEPEEPWDAQTALAARMAALDEPAPAAPPPVSAPLVTLAAAAEAAPVQPPSETLPESAPAAVTADTAPVPLPTLRVHPSQQTPLVLGPQPLSSPQPIPTRVPVSIASDPVQDAPAPAAVEPAHVVPPRRSRRASSAPVDAPVQRPGSTAGGAASEERQHGQSHSAEQPRLTAAQRVQPAPQQAQQPQPDARRPDARQAEERELDPLRHLFPQAPMTRPIALPTMKDAEDELPESLDLAARLGLRPHDALPELPSKQKIGPTS